MTSTVSTVISKQYYLSLIFISHVKEIYDKDYCLEIEVIKNIRGFITALATKFKH